MESIAASAARNNALWCDIVARAHGSTTSFDHGAWTSDTRTPTYYPDAVTLVPDVRPIDLLGRIDSSIGCSIKDSFATLDLSDSGFEVLFEATWFSRVLDQVGHATSGWDAVTSEPEFVEWERAWRGEAGPQGVIVPRLMRDERVTFAQLRSSGRLVAGAVFTASDAVVGVTNLFAEPDSAAGAWSTCVAFAAERFGGSRLVGYGTGTELTAALASGFRADGPLRVWVARAMTQ